MKKVNMTCRNCINGEPREVCSQIMISCFLSPDRKLKSPEDRCVCGLWVGYTNNLSVRTPVTFQWGEWDLGS